MTLLTDLADVSANFVTSTRSADKATRSRWQRMERALEKELTDADVRLTPEAKLMILLPLMEAFESANALNSQTVDDAKRSLKTIVSSIKSEAGPDPYTQSETERSTLSVIRSFWKNFCDIPPFCRPTEKSASATSTKKNVRKRRKPKQPR